jgi:hypothetical protein
VLRMSVLSLMADKPMRGCCMKSRRDTSRKHEARLAAGFVGSITR